MPAPARAVEGATGIRSTHSRRHARTLDARLAICGTRPGVGGWGGQRRRCTVCAAHRRDLRQRISERAAAQGPGCALRGQDPDRGLGTLRD